MSIVFLIDQVRPLVAFALRAHALDGFMPTLVHMCGFYLLSVLFYARPSAQASCENAQRFSKLGAFHQSVKLPWLVVGDYNIDVNVFVRSDFCKRVGGVIRKANVEHTCIGVDK
eukprot:8629975-Pyramimonas_sp.AAC.1